MPAFEENVTFSRRSFVAGVDLSAKQFFAINDKIIATAGKAIDGILQNNPTNGSEGVIAYGNGTITKAILASGNAVTDGVTQLEVVSGGKLQVLASGIAVAMARQTVGSQGTDIIIAVELLASNALHA